MDPVSRRNFLQFMGRNFVGLTALPLLTQCSTSNRSQNSLEDAPFIPLAPSLADDVVLAKGFQYKILIQWGDKINSKGELFGYDNDYIATLPIGSSKDDAFLWVNHENANPYFVGKYKKGGKRTRAQVHREQRAVGGSILRIKKNAQGEWKVVLNDPYNRRISARTSIPFASKDPIAGSRKGMGTLGNCAGGVTPWKTFLTCEENYYLLYGDYDYDKNHKSTGLNTKGALWAPFYKYPTEHYGWVVEINPKTGKAKKLVALGRFAHESATVVQTKDKRCVVYSGDDKVNECLYKFIASKPGSLEEGELFVADLKSGKWLSLDLKKSKALRKHFKTQTEVLIGARQAAKIVGGTPLDRPEDIEVDPATGHVYIALTNNKPKSNYHGSILKIEEDGGDHRSLTFQSSTFLSGGEKGGFSAPDNMAFDPKGNLWVTSDISDGDLGKGVYKDFGHNGLFYIPMSGKAAGNIFQVASAPKEAEFTGPCFAPDGKSLFLSVQHPGARTKDIKKPTSHWPEKNNPKPSVIHITGPVMDQLLS